MRNFFDFVGNSRNNVNDETMKQVSEEQVAFDTQIDVWILSNTSFVSALFCFNNNNNQDIRFAGLNRPL